MKNIVIFGATGNIGAYFVDDCFRFLNANEWQIVAVSRRDTSFFTKYDIPYVKTDICQEEGFAALPQKDVYAVVNLAGILPANQRETDVLRYAETIVMGGLRILEYAKSVGADRILYSQTWAELAGYWGKETVLSPKMPRNLQFTGDHAFYSIAKSMIVDTMTYYHREFGLKSFVFRLPNIYLYSPLRTYFVDGEEKIVAYRYMIDRAMRGETIELWGDPDAFKDIVYVKDLCQLMRKAILSEVDGGIYHAGTGVKTTLRQQIEGMIEVFSPPGHRSRIEFKPDKPSFVSFVMDITNARSELGYEPEYDYISYLKDYKVEMEQKRFDALWRK